VSAADGGGVEVTIGDGTAIRVPRDGRGLAPGTELTLGVRPEHLDVGEGDGPTVPAVVNLTEHLGGVTFFYSTIASDEPLTIEVSGQAFVEDGLKVPVRIDPALCHLFDNDGQALPTVPPQAKAA
jgi:multiple sugar transport system ATP-binding protein